MSINASINLMKTYLRPLGIELPESVTDTTPSVELPDVSAQDVADAIRKNGYTKPTLDLAVKHYIADDNRIKHLINTNDEDARREAYKSHLAELRDTLKSEYQKAADTINEHTPRFAAHENLNTIPASSLANNQDHSAWVALHAAIRRAEQITKAWRHAHTVGQLGSPFPGRPEQMLLITGYPTPEDYWKTVPANFDSYKSIWGQARAGWTLALATPTEVQERYNEIMAGKPEPKDPMRGVSFL